LYQEKETHCVERCISTIFGIRGAKYLKMTDFLNIEDEPIFDDCLPLNVLLGFCEDYRRVVINARHKLISIRSRNDNNCLIGDPMQKPEIVLFKAVVDASCAVERNK